LRGCCGSAYVVGSVSPGRTSTGSALKEMMRRCERRKKRLPEDIDKEDVEEEKIRC
jgi:hypothetical protein